LCERRPQKYAENAAVLGSALAHDLLVEGPGEIAEHVLEGVLGETILVPAALALAIVSVIGVAMAWWYVAYLKAATVDDVAGEGKDRYPRRTQLGVHHDEAQAEALDAGHGVGEDDAEDETAETVEEAAAQMQAFVPVEHRELLV
jgi:hypothetical protein